MGSKTSCFERCWIPVAFAIVCCMAVACAQRPSQGSALLASQDRKAAPAVPAKIQLNEDDMGTTDDTSMLSKKLVDVFKVRKEQRAYKVGMERRSDLPGEDRIEKTVFVKAERSTKLEEVTKIIEVVEEAGAEPILLPIIDPSEGKKADWMGMRTRANPLTLLVRMRHSPPLLVAPGVPSMSDYFISGGIPIILSSAATGESLVVITIAKDGEYTLGEKRLEKAALAKEIGDRIKAKPASEKVVFIKAGPDISFGSLEDIYHAAFAAGAKRIYLDTGERTITWEDQGMKFTFPAGWRKDEVLGQVPETFRFKGPDEARLNIGVTEAHEDLVRGEKALSDQYEVELKRQQNGEIDEVRYLELTGVKGLLFRYATRDADDRSVHLQWLAYRKYKGKRQFIWLTIRVALDNFNRRREELYSILSSAKLIQN